MRSETPDVLAEPTRLYILTRQDLSPAQAVVQTAHALAELFCAHPHDAPLQHWAARHKTLVVLSVPDEPALLERHEFFLQRGVRCSAFREPDLDHALTALAVHPSTSPRLFRNLKLWTPAPFRNPQASHGRC